jgi:hypothetical protein
MQKKTRREYEAPMVEIFEARVEKGFLLSATTQKGLQRVGPTTTNCSLDVPLLKRVER